ncbi:MAG: hypothetical protein KDD35_03755 [Bdellovibrionales bacterium]|nr:hypothetical protein [Bdellovibrionales bacterium]
MAIQKLSQASAFGVGASLWVLPPLQLSAWTRKLDWYLNFQISRANSHPTPKLSPTLNEIVERNGIYSLPLAKSKPEEQPLLISSHTHLPNRMTLILPPFAEGSAWIHSCHDYWDKLGRMSARFFLPATLTIDQFVKDWPEPQSSIEISLVSDMITSQS